MKRDLDTLLTALYAFLDDHVVQPRRIGTPPRLSDAELLCLAIAQALLGYDSTRRFLRAADSRLGHLFPYLPRQSGYNKRLNTAGPLIARAVQALARQVPTWTDDLRLSGRPGPSARAGETANHRIRECTGQGAYTRHAESPCPTEDLSPLDNHSPRGTAGAQLRHACSGCVPE